MRLIMAITFCAIFFGWPFLYDDGYCKSALSPRHSGLEPPGGPRPLDGIPGNSPGRTAEGGMGYSDAYGNTLTDKMPAEKKPRKRPRAGAYGGVKPEATLPEPAGAPSKPVWSFK